MAKAPKRRASQKRVDVIKPGDREVPDDVGGTTQSGEVTGATRDYVEPTPPVTPPVTPPPAI